MVFQNYLLFPYMNVGDNIGFGLKMRGINKKEIASRVAEMLELVQLPGIEKAETNATFRRATATRRPGPRAHR